MKPQAQLALAATIFLVAACVFVWVVRRERGAPPPAAGADASKAPGARLAGVEATGVQRVGGSRLAPEAFAALPKEVREAAAGRHGPDVDRMPLDVRLAADVASGGAARGGPREPGAAGGPAEGDSAVIDPEAERAKADALEGARRAGWIDRQSRRNALRAEVLVGELGASPTEAERALSALERSVAERVKLFEAADAGVLDETGISAGLATIREALAKDLADVLGAATYARLEALEASGRFVLPDEVKKPAR